MAPSKTFVPSGYWYDRDEDQLSGVDVLNLLRQYRSAESDMRRRTRDSMGMGDTDLLALRYLLQAARRGGVIRPADLAELLQISTASTTALIDRLERSGHVKRDRHPKDRRSTIVTPTVESDSEVRQTLGRMHEKMVSVADGLDPVELAAVAKFLTGIIAAVDPEREAVEVSEDVLDAQEKEEAAG